MSNTIRKTQRPDFEAIARLRALLKDNTLRAVAKLLNVNPGSISQVMRREVSYSERVRKALGLWTLPAWTREPYSVPLSHLSGGEVRQCPDCVVEYQRGDKSEPETWHWFNVKSRKRCTAHARIRRNFQRRQVVEADDAVAKAS